MKPTYPPLDPIPALDTDLAAYYRQQGYYQDQTLGQFLAQALGRDPQALAAVGLNLAKEPGPQLEEWTYRQLEEAACRAAREILACGVRPGDRVILQVPNSLQYLAYLIGSAYAGALPIFALPQQRERELEHIAAKATPALHVFSSEPAHQQSWQTYQNYRAQLEEKGLLAPQPLDVSRPPQPAQESSWPAETFPLPAHPDRQAARLSENTALMQLSGGTTGLSKLIPRTHADYLYSVRASAQICGLSPAERLLVVLPAAHNFTMSSPGILGALYAGSPLIFAADPSPQTSFSLIRNYRVTQVALVPALLQSWLLLAARRPLELESLEVIQVGGAKLAPSLAREVQPQLGARLQQVFGMAEGLVNYTRPEDPQELVVTSQGRPISPDDQILILDDQGQPLPPGKAGELLTKGPYTISCYYREPQANLTSFTPDGFYRTGDLVRQLPSGHLQVVGRIKDQINRAGEKIAVDELEDFALQLPGVLDAAVLGEEDPQLGQRVCLLLKVGKDFALTQAQARPWARQAYRQAGFADFKLPEKVLLLDSFPLTQVGKLSRRQLRAELAQQLAADKL